MFNSFLFGYGLTIYCLEKIKPTVAESNPLKNYIELSNFLNVFLTAPLHKKILRDFNKYFVKDSRATPDHDEIREFLYSHIAEINSVGFERWVSNILFQGNIETPLGYKLYIYFLYNFWFHIIKKEILYTNESKTIINNISAKILENDFDNGKIFTTNFDTVFDDTLNPFHIHGKFVVPLNDIEEIIMHYFNEKEFEYSYLFGTSGYEKASRLSDINDMTQYYYDTRFFYDKNLDFGHLLIFGLSFAKSGVIFKEFEKLHPEYDNLNIVKSIDGHIILKLEELYNLNRLNRITICFYSISDLKFYKKLFSTSILNSIISFVSTNEIYFFEE